MNDKRTLFVLPVPSVEFTREAEFCGGVIHYQYQLSDVEVEDRIRFVDIKATRTLAESCCSPWHIDGAYDVLAEVENSTWLTEIWDATEERRRRRGEDWTLHHYIIYFDSVGSIEVVAASWIRSSS